MSGNGVDPELLKMWAQPTDTEAARIQDLAEKQAAIDESTPVRYDVAVLTPQEISDCIGQLTMTCESLRRDIVALEKRIEQKKKRRSLWMRVKSWLVERWAKQLIAEIEQ